MGELAGQVVAVVIGSRIDASTRIAVAAWASEGAVIVVAGTDPDPVGELVGSLSARGHRAAAFVGDEGAPLDDEALRAFAAEVFGAFTSCWTVT